ARPPRRAATRMPAGRRRRARGKGRPARAPGSFLQRLSGARSRLVRLLYRLGGLRRHVVLVVLGEHLARVEDAVGAELALRDHALALAEEVRQRPLVDDGYRLRRIRDDEVHRDAVGLAA